MKEAIIKYRDSRTLELLKSLAKYFDFSISEHEESTPKVKEHSFTVLNVDSKNISLIVMRQISDRVFMDTNILVYARTDVDAAKQVIAQKLITENFSFISTQVLQELANTLNRKFNHTWAEIEKVLADAARNNNLCINSEVTVKGACRLANRYNF